MPTARNINYTNLEKNGKSGKRDVKKPVGIVWEKLNYKEMIIQLDKLTGPQPPVPEDITFPKWSPQAIRVLEERYFKKDIHGKSIETVQEMCWRVAWEIARAEAKYGKKRREIISQARVYYKLMGNRWFIPNSPTLMNAGKGNELQYSACYVIPVEDSLTGIFDGIKWQALVHQSGGGTGFSFSRLRPEGARVKSTMGVASGPVSFMRIYNEATQQIKQGGMRRGANMGILRVDHPDILNFIHAKDDGVSVTNFNISVAVTDKFMTALANGEEYELVSPHEDKVVGKLSARMVWDEIAKGAHKTGDPGVIFLDRINASPANPIRAEGWLVESTNPCGEQPLYPFDACNLGSIFLKYYIKGENGKSDVDWKKLRETVRSAVRFLDSVIEMNPFPLPQITATVQKIRRIGLGVGGWADMLVILGIPYDSKEALKLAEKIMKFINEESHQMSKELAEVRGPFPMWKESIYAKKPMRNSTVTTIAPTGSIGILADCSGGIEPLFAIAYQHIVKSENRTLNFVNPIFENVAKTRGFYNGELIDKVVEHGTVRDIENVPDDVKKVFGTAHEIHPDWHVKMQAAFQKYTDNAVSKTINLSNQSTTDDIQSAYDLAWKTGCRGITVFRDGSKSEQVLNMGVKDKPQETANGVKKEDITPWVRPVRVNGSTYKLKTPVGTAFITVNEDEKGNPFEVFINIGKAGSDIAAIAEAMGRVISKSLKFNGNLTSREKALVIVDQLKGIGGRTSVGFGPNKVRSLPDAIGIALATQCGFRTNGNGNGSLGVALGSAEAAVGAQKDGISAAHKEGAILDPALALTEPNAASNLELFPKEVTLGDICPSCGKASLVYEEGCTKCYSCGHSEC